MANDEDLSKLISLAQLLARWTASDVKLGDEAVHWRYEGHRDKERPPCAWVAMRGGRFDVHLTWSMRSPSGVVSESKAYYPGGDWDDTLPPEFVEFMDRHFRRESQDGNS